ncbi:MAG: helix-turn-helix domain-containing protein [Planctomycetota bacterium]
MVQLTRKQREIQEREQLFVATGRRLLLERGYAGLTMDRIAEATEYSKGTVYQHFANKEDLLVAVLVGTCSTRRSLFERAAAFRGTPRDRMAAIGIAVEIFRAQHPDADAVEHLSREQSFREKATPETLLRLQASEQATLEICFGITRDGIAIGDLELAEEARISDITLGLWSLYQGTFAILDGMPTDELGFPDPLETMRQNAQRLLDAFDWKPLSTDTDLDAQRERILGEVFPEEREALEPS